MKTVNVTHQGDRVFLRAYTTDAGSKEIPGPYESQSGFLVVKNAKRTTDMLITPENLIEAGKIITAEGPGRAVDIGASTADPAFYKKLGDSALIKMIELATAEANARTDARKKVNDSASSEFARRNAPSKYVSPSDLNEMHRRHHAEQAALSGI